MERQRGRLPKESTNMNSKLRGWLSRIPTSQTLLLGSLAVVVGLGTGAGVWIFKWMIGMVQLGVTDLSGLLAPAGAWILVPIAGVGGVLAWIILRYGVGHERIHGVAGIIESMALAGGRLRYRTVPLKALAAAVSIGVGAPLGPEDPSVQIGANLGSMLAQKLRLSDDRIRLLVAAGAAAAIAAAFNAPIAGVFFALELILVEINASSLGMLLVASVASSVLTQAISGPEPAFHIPTYAIHSAWELPLYLGLGLLAGPVSAAYIRLLYLLQDWVHGIRLQAWMKAAVIGLVVGAAGLILPQIKGTGYGTIQEILNVNDLSLWLLLALLCLRIILTPLSLAGGFSGGVFAPSLYLGSVLGGAYGLVVMGLLPGLAINPPAFALVGMAALLAGAVRAPLTAIILLFEMTNDYRIILPVMLAVAASVLLSDRLQRESIYLAALARLGIRLDQGRDIDVLRGVTVGEAMQVNLSPLPESLSLTEAADALAAQRRQGLPVVDADGLLVGMLTLQDIFQVDAGQRATTTVGGVCSRDLMLAFPEESLHDALLRMGRADVGRLPVVDRNFNRRLLGMLRRADVIRAYEIALARRTEQRHRAGEVRLDALTPERVHVADVTIQRGAACEDRLMRDVHWPAGSLIASVRRGSEVFIPHGETVLRAGDVLVVVAEGKAREQVLELCRAVEED